MPNEEEDPLDQDPLDVKEEKETKEKVGIFDASNYFSLTLSLIDAVKNPPACLLALLPTRLPAIMQRLMASAYT
jgi:hypothetical protein